MISPSNSILIDAGLEHANVRQVAVIFIVVQTEAHHELVGNVEAHIVGGQGDLAALGLVEKGADLYLRYAHFPIVNRISDKQLDELATAFGINYRKEFLDL